MRLEQDGVTGMDMSDMSYVTSGYAPLTGRLVQAILLQGGVSAEIQKLLPVSVKEYRQEMASSLREWWCWWEACRTWRWRRFGS